MKTRVVLFVTAVLLQALTGCIGEKAFTMMARSGDTVTLAIGGSPYHEIDSHVKKGDMLVTITDSANNTYEVTLRNLLRVYSDRSNRYNYNARYDTLASNWLSHRYTPPNEGLWVAVVNLTDPNTGAPLPLLPGTATFQVTTPDLAENLERQGLNGSDGFLSQIEIEILPGTGSPHPFHPFADPVDLEPLPQVKFSIDNSAVAEPYVVGLFDDKIGGIEFVLDYDENYFDDAKFPPMVLGNNKDPRIRVLSAENTVGSNKVLKVLILAPSEGVVAQPDVYNQLSLIASRLEDLSVFVVWDAAYVNGSIDASNYSQVFQVSGYKVVDLDGVPLLDANNNPMVTLVSELHLY